VKRPVSLRLPAEHASWLVQREDKCDDKMQNFTIQHMLPGAFLRCPYLIIFFAFIGEEPVWGFPLSLLQFFLL